MPILEFQHVSKVYHNSTKALDDLSFSVEEGEFLSIIGPSGAGKSTILRCINRLIDATEGKIIYDGADVMQVGKGQLRKIRTKTGMIFQHYNLVDRLSVMENVLHGRLGQKSTFTGMIGHYTEAEKEKAFSILSELGLAEQAYKRCDALSGGQKQRVGIARAIMQEPKLILCDEPIASLDPKASKTIMDHLAQINQTRKITCIVNLHQVDVAMKYSNRILGIAAGKVVFNGTPAELTQEKIHAIYQSNDKDFMNAQIQAVFRRRKMTYTLLILVVLGIYFFSSTITKFHFTEGLLSFPKAFVWIGENLIPDELAIRRFPKILDKLIETVLLSVAVTVLAAIFAFFVSLFGSKATDFPRPVNQLVRMIAAFFRNVPDVVWAMLLMFSFGQNILTGFFALFFTTFGMLTRAFIETIEEASSDCIEALRASGANFAQTVFQGIIPSVIPGIVTWVLYMIETNIRSSTLIGILTATGIGYLFDMYYKRLDFSSASLVVLLIIATVIIIELISNQIRKVIL